MKSITNFVYDVIIIGAGPAGLTAAIYAKRANLSVLIIEKGAVGGKIIKTELVENFTGFGVITGYNLAQQMHNHVKSLDVEIVTEEVLDIILQADYKLITTNVQTWLAKGVIVATGTTEKKLGVVGEDFYYGKGVSHCAVCDGTLYRNKIIAVVGGGYSACEEAIYLTRYATEVWLIHRRDEFTIDPNLLYEINNHAKIKILTHTIVETIEGDEHKVTKLNVVNLINGQQTILHVSALFIYIGHYVAVNFLSNLDLKDEHQNIIFDKTTFETKIPGIFIAGDLVPRSLQQISIAVGDGTIAGQFIVKYIDHLKKIK